MHGTITKIDLILGHKESLGKCQRKEIIQSMISDNHGSELEISNKRIT